MKYLPELVKIINDNYIYAWVAKFGDKFCILFLQWFMEFEYMPLSEILMACLGGKLGCLNFEEKCFDHVICTKGFTWSPSAFFFGVRCACCDWCHYYISIQNPTKKSDGLWISLFKLTKNHKDTFFFCKCGHKRRWSDGYSHNRRLSDRSLVSVA